jgi:cellulose synthase/poly-beta-1,6-N-acetylglucosamine synthase-like glycosyltransferase
MSHQFLTHAFSLVENGIIVYVAVVHIVYLFVMVLGALVFRAQPGRLTRTENTASLRSPLVPPISLIAPAFNESATIRDSVRAMVTLHYPKHEVIVVNDGSTDDTLQILIDEFHLYRSAREPSRLLSTAPVRAIYESRRPIRLVVIDKENGGGKADALNAALNVARTPLVAVLDADSVVEADALLAMVKPFLEDPERTLATGGIVRVANGCSIDHGRVVRIAAPRSTLGRFQVVEYLRAFLHGRVAFSFLNSVMLVSGAFGVFRRDAVIAAGGYDTTTVGEDMELVIRLHRIWREWKKPYRIVFVPYPVCWTQVPESMTALHEQRNRWQRGTVESLWRHRRMFCNPRYGAIGLIGFPYFVLFETVGPLIECAGYVLTAAGLAFRLISPLTAWVFVAVSVLFGLLVSVTAVLLEDFTARRYPAIRDIALLMCAAVAENFGFRQRLTWWRAKGVLDACRGKTGWGTMERRGFHAAA